MCRHRGFFFVATLLVASLSIQAWDGRLTGALQSDVLMPASSMDCESLLLTNTYADFTLRSTYFEAGTRLEFLQYPLPGFESDFRGWGLPHLHLTGHYGKVEVTVGDVYDQFGSGLILRTYESRPLGIDNALRGGRLAVEPLPGVALKVLGGAQRRYWQHNKGYVLGGDVSLSIDSWISSMSTRDLHLTLGLSGVNKHEPTEGAPTMLRTETDGEGFPQLNLYTLHVPENVQAGDVRAQFRHGGWNVLAEYALKSHDPSADNDWVFRHGHAMLLSTSWSKTGMSALVQVKRSEDMSFRSRRNMVGLSSFINHLPAFTMQHTYALAALYPYATQYAPGEWAFQTELAYTLPKGSRLGGRYGTSLALHASHIRSLRSQQVNESTVLQVMGTAGEPTDFWPGDKVYYQDINVQLSKRINRGTKINLMYMNQIYDKTIVEGEGGMIHSHIFVAEGRFTLGNSMVLRCEGQYLHTRQDEGDWWYALAELSLKNAWMLSVSDMYNPQGKDHFARAGVTWTGGSHRVQAAYGRTRAGFNCAGGVCRYVPESKGWSLSYNYVF